jgi:hypothetical protein
MTVSVDWLGLFGHFLLLSLLAVGGAITVVPDMHRVLVTQMGLLTDTQFNASIAIAQASPGPNVLFVAVMGYQAAGLAGAAVTLIGIMLPAAEALCRGSDPDERQRREPSGRDHGHRRGCSRVGGCSKAGTGSSKAPVSPTDDAALLPRTPRE